MGYMDELNKQTKEELVNNAFNDAVASMSDVESMAIEGGKSIPYVGWFWRRTDFVNKKISIGRCVSEDSDKGFIGVMENNKWDYPERMMTKAEATKFIDYLEIAMHERNQGGCVADTEKACKKVLQDMWTWFQTLKV